MSGLTDKELNLDSVRAAEGSSQPTQATRLQKLQIMPSVINMILNVNVNLNQTCQYNKCKKRVSLIYLSVCMIICMCMTWGFTSEI